MKNPFVTLYDFEQVFKIFFCQWAAPYIQKIRIRLGLNPYTKLDYRMRFGNHILPHPLTHFHCLCCNKFTLRKAKFKLESHTYNWAGFNWKTSNTIYECKECFEQGKKNREAYLAI